MITVRYPGGLAVTYNAGWYVVVDDRCTRIYDKAPDKGGSIIAQIQASAGATIEWVKPCKTELATLTIEKAAAFLAEHPDELKKLPAHVARDLKRAFAVFNATRGVWP